MNVGYIRVRLDCVIYVSHVLGHVQLAVKFNLMISFVMMSFSKV